MLKGLSSSVLLAFLFGVSWFQNVAAKCTLDHSKAHRLNEKETIVAVNETLKSNYDASFTLDFKTGLLENLTDVRAWCVDLSRKIGTNKYSMDTISSIDPDSHSEVYKACVDKPEYLPSLNWLMNTHPVNSIINLDTNSSCMLGKHRITDREYQLATWTTIDDDKKPASYWQGGSGKQCVVDHLVKLTRSKEAMSYEPDCENQNKRLVGLLLVVDKKRKGGKILMKTIHRQVLIAAIPLVATGICDCKEGAKGDPHFITWSGEHYDFHGVCDLVFLHNPGFEKGLGMDIHIRTTKTRMWSYISTAAIRIGEDILEITGGANKNKFWINGVEGDTKELNSGHDEVTLLPTLSGFAISFKQFSIEKQEFIVKIGKDESIIFETWNSFVSIRMENKKYNHFKNSVGLMGSFPEGVMLARDNISVMDNMDHFGQEWQVLASESMLFHDIKGPQHPGHCEVPSHSEMRRRLGDSTITLEDAKKACENVDVEVMEFCIFDVMATNNESTNGVY